MTQVEQAMTTIELWTGLYTPTYHQLVTGEFDKLLCDSYKEELDFLDDCIDLLNAEDEENEVAPLPQEPRKRLPF